MVAASASLLAGRLPTLSETTPGARLGVGLPFSPDDLIRQAEALPRRAYVAPQAVPQAWSDLTYDQYRDIRFRPEAALWRGTAGPFEAQLFSPGFYFGHGVSVALVADGVARKVLFDRAAFSFGPSVPALPDDDALDYSGFRLHAALNRDDHRDEFAVFQGASYFRGVGRGQAYGLSARGLAIDTAEPAGEEFPVFRAYWIETPAEGAASVRVHALLDSPGVTGAYSFDIAPGDPTVMDISASLFPRRELGHVGIAPLTSMFLYDDTNRSRFDDFRPAVHDSDGLMVVNGAGEQIWRPLANPSVLQVSQFLDTDPRGFGLVQRTRHLAGFADLEARYEKRPSAWVEPGVGWGKGSVSLVEIPTDREINDNIVAYWRPAAPLVAGARFDLSYRLSWCWEPPPSPRHMKVVNTSMGAKGENERLVVIDFAPSAAPVPDAAAIIADAAARPGPASPPVVQHNPATGGLRLAFSFETAAADSVELRAQLRDRERRSISEVWLYRWTK